MCEKNIFQITYRRVLKRYKLLKGIDNFKNFFIDSTMIKNVQGSEKVGPNHYDRNKNGTKVTAIVDDLGAPMCFNINKANESDVKITIPIMKKLKFDNVNVISDKGYICLENKTILSKKGINLIYPYRRNQNLKNIASEIVLMRKRNIVEIFFSWFKQFRRIRNRYDRKIICYKNFVLLGLTYIVYRKYKEL